MKYLFLIISFGCASVPDKVLKQIHEEKLAGYWVMDPSDSSEDFVKISCDGEIKFDYKDRHAVLFRQDRDEAKIKRVRDGEIAFKSWTSIRHGMKYQKPVQKEDGCWEFNFNGWKFSGEPADCSKPKMGFMESLSDAFNSKPSKCYSDN